MATISSLGIGSGLDLNALLTKLTEVEKQRLTPYTTQQSSYNAKLTAYGTLKGALEKFDDVSKELAKPDAFTMTKASSHEQFSVTTSSSAVTGNYSIEVKQLAQAQSLSSPDVSSQTDQLGTPGTSGRELSITVGQPPQETKISLSDDQTSLVEMRDAINKSNAGVKASIIRVKDDQYQLSLTATEMGADSNIIIFVSGDDKLSDLLNYDGSDTTGAGGSQMRETVAGKNAIMIMNGTEIERSSNRITDAPQGVTIELKSLSDTKGTQNLVISSDTEGVIKKVKSWVDTYNTLVDTFSSLTKYTPVKQGETPSSSNGALLGDNTLRTIQSDIKGIMSSAQDNPNLKGIGNLGISTDPKTGKLTLDEEKLTKVVGDYPDQLQKFFMGDGKETGLATMVHNEIQNYIKSDGVIDDTTKSINNSLQHLSDRIDSVNRSIDVTINRYKAQFVQLDTMMSGLNSTSVYLSQQFDAMNSYK